MVARAGLLVVCVYHHVNSFHQNLPNLRHVCILPTSRASVHPTENMRYPRPAYYTSPSSVGAGQHQWTFTFCCCDEAHLFKLPLEDPQSMHIRLRGKLQQSSTTNPHKQRVDCVPVRALWLKQFSEKLGNQPGTSAPTTPASLSPYRHTTAGPPSCEKDKSRSPTALSQTAANLRTISTATT